ncbi:MAG: sodium:proton antiporter [Lachnospiraceae bacterium]|nr:sodium:proton antiporter [Lachnospiraceae bacterium]
MSIMEFIICILFLIVLIHIVNDKTLHMQSDIALLFFSLCISVIILVVANFTGSEKFLETIRQVGDFGFEEYLIDFVLCFMLFAGASKVNMRKFKQNIKAVSLLALLSTVVSSVLFGLLFYVSARIAGLGCDIWVCILLGCIVSPTDPIAATGILNKLGLSKNVTSIIENESLFNDGTGVALFVFIKSIVSQSGKSNFFIVMFKEIAGAVVVALLVSFVLFRILELTKNPVMHLLISFLDVSFVYVVCEHSGFSGVIASVVCGMYFAYKMDGISRSRKVFDPHNFYTDTWEVLDSILNAVLFVMVGISVLDIAFTVHLAFVVFVTIICVVVSRFMGVGIASLLTGQKKIPSSYSLFEFVTLMTWSALKGGLSLALAMSTKEFLDYETYLIVLDAAYVTIFFTVLVQGLTISRVYQKLEKHKAARIRSQSEVPR